MQLGYGAVGSVIKIETKRKGRLTSPIEPRDRPTRNHLPNSRMIAGFQARCDRHHTSWLAIVSGANRKLDKIPDYDGHVGDIDVALIRHDVQPGVEV